MPRATLASRTLKNKDTGLDLFVPTYKETKGLVTNNVHYQVVLVSSLSCFKAPSHKETDIVQYSIEKKFAEFEEMRSKVAELFSGTMLPPINKKSIIVNEQVLRERRNSLDAFLKFLASTKKLSTCQPLLQFLGVDSIRAKKFSRGESLDQNQQSSKPPQEDEEDDKTPSYDVFGDEEDTVTEELFHDEFVEEKTGEESIFESGGITVFDGQDLKRELTVEDEADFSFVPDAITSKKVTTDITEVQEDKERQENNDQLDLFEFDDDLDQLMKVKIGKKTKEATNVASSSSPALSAVEASGLPVKPKVAKKPTIPFKPLVSAKPAIPSKPKPAAKPNVPQKPMSGETSHSKVSDSSSSETKTSKVDLDIVSDLGQDDILKYLEAQSESANDDLDLFS